MMGANWQTDQQRSIEEKFAWWPVRSGSNKRIWLKPYFIQYTYYDDNGKPPIKGPSWEYIYTQNEYLIEQLKK
jgi:hypothetical protein